MPPKRSPEPPPKRCRICRAVYRRGPNEKPNDWEDRMTCGKRACAAAWGHRMRESYRQRQLHRCALDGCSAFVQRRDGEYEARYRRRHYCCDEHRYAGRGRKRTKRYASWRLEERVCATEGCAETFRPKNVGQKHHSHPCSVRGRARGKPRETKTCECGCGETFERPAGLGHEQWTARRFVDSEHRARGGWLRVGESRAGARREPRVPPKRPPRPKPEPKEPKLTTVFGDAPPTEPFRPGRVPVVEPVRRAAPRPSFGLTRRPA